MSKQAKEWLSPENRKNQTIIEKVIKVIHRNTDREIRKIFMTR